MGPLGAFFSHLFYVAEVVIIQNKKGLAKFGYIQYMKVLKQRSFYFLSYLNGANNKLKSGILEVFFFLGDLTNLGNFFHEKPFCID